MSSFLFTVSSFLVALGVLITVHELGHFWVARKLGVKILRFSIGFGRPLWKRTGRRDGTEYVVAVLPLGGYVKMLDEREEPVDEQERDRAFNNQSIAARSAIVAAGPVFNFLFAILAFWLVAVSGETGVRPVIGEVEPGSLAEEVGFQVGDELISVAGRPTPTWESAVFALLAEFLRGEDLPVRVQHGSNAERIRWLPGSRLPQLADDGRVLESLGLQPQRPRLPAVVGEVLAGEPAAEAGVRPGDEVVKADGTVIDSWEDLVAHVKARPGQQVELGIRRDGELISVVLTPARHLKDGAAEGRIGAKVRVPDDFGEEYRIEIRYGPLKAAQVAVEKTWDMSVLMLKMLGRMLVGEASVKNLSGPISIAESAGKSASYGATYFLKFLAVVSISLGILNLLPIPVLDGGHLLYFAIEVVKGSPLSEKAMEKGQQIGILLLLALMSLAFYLDISRLLG